MQRQLDWFKKQVVDIPEQSRLFEADEAPRPDKPPEQEKRTVRAYSGAPAEAAR